MQCDYKILSTDIIKTARRKTTLYTSFNDYSDDYSSKPFVNLFFRNVWLAVNCDSVVACRLVYVVCQLLSGAVPQERCSKRTKNKYFVQLMQRGLCKWLCICTIQCFL